MDEFLTCTTFTWEASQSQHRRAGLAKTVGGGVERCFSQSIIFPNCGSSISETQEGKTPSPSISRHASFDTDQVSKDFVEFLKNLQKPGREIHKQCRAFIMNMSSKKVSCTLNKRNW